MHREKQLEKYTFLLNIDITHDFIQNKYKKVRFPKEITIKFIFYSTENSKILFRIVFWTLN